MLAGNYQLSYRVIDYAGPSIGAIAVNLFLDSPDSALREADAVMYIDKKRRKREAALKQ